MDLNGLAIKGNLCMDQPTIINHVNDYFEKLYTSTNQVKPLFDRLEFSKISSEPSTWIKSSFGEAEIHQASVDLKGDRAPGPDVLMYVYNTAGTFG
ncbi:hypothetical protein FRX31_028277 [Thalictrum thalictroides]|uniref:Uncharacterized protein n=1 Tax=Thalictrum thalictroides TaxID=46969 RepID=A0A7J6VD44_THATH|nr:hypothetical protein FRX31_028277 [Thalictrum thalictroides]